MPGCLQDPAHNFARPTYYRYRGTSHFPRISFAFVLTKQHLLRLLEIKIAANGALHNPPRQRIALFVAVLPRTVSLNVARVMTLSPRYCDTVTLSSAVLRLRPLLPARTTESAYLQCFCLSVCLSVPSVFRIACRVSKSKWQILEVRLIGLARKLLHYTFL